MIKQIDIFSLSLLALFVSATAFRGDSIYIASLLPIVITGLVIGRLMSSPNSKLIRNHWIFLIQNKKYGEILDLLKKAFILKNGLLIYGIASLINYISIIFFLNRVTNYALVDQTNKLLIALSVTTFSAIICIFWIGVIQKTAQKLGYGDSGAW